MLKKQKRKYRLQLAMIGLIGSQLTNNLFYSEDFPNFLALKKASAFTAIVNSGDTVTDEIVDGASQDVYGTAVNTAINSGGNQYVHIDGVTTGTQINAGGSQTLSGGFSETVELNGGNQYVNSGTTTGVKINLNGNQFIYSGGIATDVEITSGGYQYIYGGATSDVDIKSGGNQRVYGSAVVSDIEISGTQTLVDGGSVTNSTINLGGVQDITLGTTTDTKIAGGSQIVRSGTTSDVTITLDGLQEIYGPAVVTNVEITSGRQYIDGGTVSDVRVGPAGIQEVWSGIATGNKIDSGGKQLLHGGLVIDTTIAGGGIQELYSGGTAQDTQANDGGMIYFARNGANLTGDTILNGGIIAFDMGTDVINFVTGNVANLSGNGQIHLNTNLEILAGDLLVINGTSVGNYQVYVNNQGNAVVNPTDTLTVIETADGGANFSIGHQVEVGGYLYDIQKAGTNWQLFTTQEGTSSASASINAFSGNYLLNYAETQSLIQRLGDLRQKKNGGNIWTKAFGGEFNSSANSFLSGYNMSYHGIQIGSDKQISLKQGKGDLYLGGMLGYSKGSQDYGVGHGSIDAKSLGIYGTYVAPTGFYTDLTVKHSWLENDFKVLDTAGDWVTGDTMKTNGLTLSLELGQRIHFNQEEKQGWYVEPQGQIILGHQNRGSFNASNGLQVDVDSYNSTLGRLGLLAGYELKSGKNPVNVYAKASYVHEFDGDISFRMNGIRAQESFGGSWWTWGLGVTAQFSNNHNIYFDIERASGGKFNQPWSVNGGYRFNW